MEYKKRIANNPIMCYPQAGGHVFLIRSDYSIKPVERIRTIVYMVEKSIKIPREGAI
jgi:hypothetical protein